MADEIDIATAVEERQRSLAIAHARAPIAEGEAGECDGCMERMPRLVRGLCGFCRDGRLNPRAVAS